METSPAIWTFSTVAFIAAWLFCVYYRFVKDCYDQDRETRKRHRVDRVD